MNGTPVRLAGPLALTNTYTTNVFNPGSSLIRDVITRIHIVNKTSGTVTFRLYLGATGENTAGTELFYDYPVAANSTYDWYGELPMDSTDYLVGGASASTSLTIEIEGYRIVKT